MSNAPIALVTGASRGIGAAVALAMAKAGCHLVLIARTVGGLEETDNRIQAIGGSATLVPLDLVAEADAIDILGANLFQRFGALDYFMHCAGTLGALSPLAHLEPVLWQKTFALNVHAPMRLLRSLDALLRTAKQNNATGRVLFAGGRIDNNQPAYWSLYHSCLAAQQAMLQSYAAETGLAAQVFDVGAVDTAFYRGAFPGKPATTSAADIAEKIAHAILSKAA